MPELAEVEYYRRQWDGGLGQKILAVALHAGKRIFRGMAPALLRALAGETLVGSEARGKQLLFRFSGDAWLGVHLGMTGQLSVASADHKPDKHDHLVLYQAPRALVFRDPRLFGRVQFHRGSQAPPWWANLPPAVNSPQFRRATMRTFLRRHPKLPIKAALLLQRGFPGIGNWMADEILWRAGIHPNSRTGALAPKQIEALWRNLQLVCRGAMKHVSPAFADPPPGWLFHERWSEGGRCPAHGTLLSRETIGGRTTAYCRRCQPRRVSKVELHRARNGKASRRAVA